jgi:hypothetical protein
MSVIPDTSTLLRIEYSFRVSVCDEGHNTVAADLFATRVKITATHPLKAPKTSEVI